jgi:hypothetical protein
MRVGGRREAGVEWACDGGSLARTLPIPQTFLGDSRMTPGGLGASESPTRARQTAMAIVDVLLMLDSTLAGDPIRGRSGSPANLQFKYFFSRREYGVVAIESIAGLIVPADQVGSLGYAERFRRV